MKRIMVVGYTMWHRKTNAHKRQNARWKTWYVVRNGATAESQYHTEEERWYCKEILQYKYRHCWFQINTVDDIQIKEVRKRIMKALLQVSEIGERRF